MWNPVVDALIGALVSLVVGGGAVFALFPKYVEGRMETQRIRMEAETKVAIENSRADALGDRAIADAMTMASSSLSQTIAQNSSLVSALIASEKQKSEMQRTIANLRTEVEALKLEVSSLQTQLLGMQTQAAETPSPN